MIKWLVTEGVGFMIATAVVAGLTGLGCTYSCGWRRDSADSAMGPSAAERAPQAERQKPRVALVHGGCSNPVRTAPPASVYPRRMLNASTRTHARAR
eukprot:COSAG02_NODE_10265_length_1982_cov_17.656896_3_plen_97_part_00